MTEDDKIVIEVKKHELRHNIGKQLVGMVVGLLATAVAETVYESVTKKRPNQTIETDQ